MIIGLCGRVGAGKETLTQFLRDRGFIYLETGKMLFEELGKLGLELTRKNQQDLADSWRKKYGVGILMQKFLDRASENNNYIIDSLRNGGEATYLREKVKDFILIGVDAPQKLRYERIIRRGKPSDPKNWEDFLKMDERDNFDASDPMGQQTGKLLEMADFVIVNDSDLARSMGQIEEIYKKIETQYKPQVNQ